jgi:hypothetical protein
MRIALNAGGLGGITSIIAFTSSGLTTVPSYITIGSIISGFFTGSSSISQGLLSGRK